MKLHYATVIIGLVFLSTASSYADTTTKQLAPGITLTQEIDKSTPLLINLVTVDLDTPGVRVETGIGQDHVGGDDPSHGREEVSGLARRHGALVAINGDYFPFTGDPLGIGIRNGEIFSEPWIGNDHGGPRVALGITQDNRAVFNILGYIGDLQAADRQRYTINGIDRAVNKDDIVLFTPLYGPTTIGKPGGTEVLVSGVNLPVRANKLMAGVVKFVHTNATGIESIPSDGVVLSGGSGGGGAFLASHMHTGDHISFVLGIAQPTNVNAGIKVAEVPRTAMDMPSRAGENVDRTAFQWGSIAQAIGGGPRLLADGRVVLDAAAEGFDSSFSDHTHPRTAVGSSADGKRLYLLTVDGRQSISKGVTLHDLALILKRYGVSEAINLDGGGSTVMAVSGMTIDSPGGTGEERPVADMLLVYSDHSHIGMPTFAASDVAQIAAAGTVQNAAGVSDSVRIVPTQEMVTLGSITPITLVDGSRTIPGDSSDVLWQGITSDGVGFVNQKGEFIAIKPGTGKITALYHAHLLTTSIIVLGKTPDTSLSMIYADFAKGRTTAPLHSQLTVRVLDQSNKPIAGAPIEINVTGGTADRTDAPTDIDGGVTFGITWISNEGGCVTVTSKRLASLTLGQPKNGN